MDTLTPQERSARMARIRSKNTKPELVVRRTLHRLGYRFRLHSANLPGKPDLVLATHKQVIFVHGCFWHAHRNCSIANIPKSRKKFWLEKFARNKARDAKHRKKLQRAGWRVITVWECETKSAKLEDVLNHKINGLAVAKRSRHGRK